MESDCVVARPPACSGKPFKIKDLIFGACSARGSFGSLGTMRSLQVPPPRFLAQPCTLPPLLVSEIDAARLLGIGRAQVKELIADRHLQLVDVNGLPR